MSSKNKGDSFDCRKEYEARIAPLVKDVCVRAGALRIPYVMLFAVQNDMDAGKTEYVAKACLASTNKDLDTDFIRLPMVSGLAAAAGLECVNAAPKGVVEAMEAVEEAKGLMTEKERKAAETLARLIRPTRWIKDAVRTMAEFAARCPRHVRKDAATVAHYCRALLDIKMARQDMPALADDRLTPIAKCVVAGHDMDLPKDVIGGGEKTIWDD